MVSKLVAVDGGLHLPTAVRDQLSADLVSDMQTYVDDAETAAGTATSAAASASTSASTASAAAATATAPTDSMVAALLANPASASGDYLADQLVLKDPAAQTGTYAARPVASGVPLHTLYYATDIPEVYRRISGPAWTATGSGGNELGNAQITGALTTSSGTLVDATGLTTTFMVGERPIEIRFNGEITHSAAGGETRVSIVLDGSEIAWASACPAGAAKWGTYFATVRVSSLTPGTSHTAKIQFRVLSGGGTAYVGGNPLNPASISVVTR